jgi:hypothetical protein
VCTDYRGQRALALDKGTISGETGRLGQVGRVTRMPSINLPPTPHMPKYQSKIRSSRKSYSSLPTFLLSYFPTFPSSGTCTEEQLRPSSIAFSRPQSAVWPVICPQLASRFGSSRFVLLGARQPVCLFCRPVFALAKETEHPPADQELSSDSS